MHGAKACRIILLLSMAGALVASCTTRGRGGPVGNPDDGDKPGDVDENGYVSGCRAGDDSDGDGLADLNETTDGDKDRDGIVNSQDLDSDGDGISDHDEQHGFDPCARVDTDYDESPDAWDLDSDNDGLSDSEEAQTFHTDPYNKDSDDDGVTDLGEVRGTMTDPLDASSTINPKDFFVVLPYSESNDKILRFDTTLRQADVYFLIDTTASMGGPIQNVRTSLSRIAASVRMDIEDTQLGVGHFEDFPFESGDPWEGNVYGGYGNKVYENLQDITDNLSLVQNALNTLSPLDGGDGPEASTEALYQVATGEGGNWVYGLGGSTSIPQKVCPSAPDEEGRRRGYPCFRPGALPIIVHVTDVDWHNGPGGSNPYANIGPSPHTFDDAAAQLQTLGARYIGVSVDGGGWNNDQSMAMATGSVDGSGNPLVYTASYGEVSDEIIDGIRQITGATPEDVSTRADNVAGNPDDFDATTFIKSITPLQSYHAGAAGEGYTSKDDVYFYGVTPGTEVEFTVHFSNDVREPSDTAQIFKATIIVVGNGVATLDSRNVYIVVPPEGGVVLI